MANSPELILKYTFLLALLYSCKIAKAIEKIDADKANIIFYAGPTYKDSYTFPLTKAGDVLNLNEFKKNKKATLYIVDYFEPQLFSSHYIVNAYLKASGINFLMLDWGAPMVNNEKDVKEPDVEKLIPLVADFILELRKGIEYIHILSYAKGFELASNVAHAIIAKTKHNATLSRLTGLDPAKNLTIMGKLVTQNIVNHPAKFVDIIHTNTNKFGSNLRLGHADFWPNGGGSQPACKNSKDVYCSRKTSWAYWAESVSEPIPAKQFCAYEAYSFREYSILDPNQLPDPIFMGINCSPEATGNYFLNVNSKYPYAKGCF